MSWNYRVVRYRNSSGVGLHEVYYDDKGQPWSMTAEPVRFAADSVEELTGDLMTAHTDARRRPVLDEPEVWPGKAP